MPLIQVTMVEGRTTEQKHALIRNLSASMSETLGVPLERIRVAIYEISHENISALTAASAVSQLALDRGAFQANKPGGSYAAAAQMLASLGQGGFGTMGSNLLGLTNPAAQDQLLVVPIGAPAVLAGFGLLGLGLMRRRMK